MWSVDLLGSNTFGHVKNAFQWPNDRGHTHKGHTNKVFLSLFFALGGVSVISERVCPLFLGLCAEDVEPLSL